ncbi:fatty acid synthase [Brachionus plicatilis]|uniref:oleoyl-[acyl-carrier-protein] hydrolase n=1 Tax=Brachionus plicatilis TaxID=10195 RepID=A0A3M7T709_BRAPC|nr:fatty acid synthase [Brachionus plicatilis]
MFKLPSKPLKKLNNVVEKRSVFFILAGLEANCDCFESLGDELSNHGVQVYALEYSKEVPVDSIQSVAAFYLNLIEQEISQINTDCFNLAGYSFGGLISIEICRQVEIDQRLRIQNLIIIESSHTFFRLGVHSNSKRFGINIPNRDIFLDQKIYTGTLAIYFSFMVGQMGQKFRFELYKYLNERKIKDLDEAIDLAFGYVNGDQDQQEKKEYLKILMQKSNAGLVYTYDQNHKIKSPVSLIKTKELFYKDLNLEFVDKDGVKKKFDFDSENYDLKKILDKKNLLKIFIVERGNHFNFMYESIEQLTDIILNLVLNFTKSKI